MPTAQDQKNNQPNYRPVQYQYQHVQNLNKLVSRGNFQKQLTSISYRCGGVYITRRNRLLKQLNFIRYVIVNIFKYNYRRQ